jgi:UDP-N-acetylglucosamine 4,6-dehydratase
MKKKILITGGTGYLGRNLAINLKDDFDITIAGRNNFLNKEAELITGCFSIPLDISNIESVRDAFNRIKPDIVIHAAATKYVDISENNPFECIDVNVLGSQNIARVAIDKEIELVIGISTDKTAPPVSNTYGLSKAIMERVFFNLSDKFTTKFISVRFGNIVWSTGSVFPIWKKMMEMEGKISSTGPNMRRFFFNVDDASKLVIRVLNNFNTLNGKIITMKMKSAQISSILDVWCKIFNINWQKIDERSGDKVDENLIGHNEIKNSYLQTIDNIKHIIIDYKDNFHEEFIEPITSLNSERLTEDEISDLINFNNKK